jgi:hypothetical protein
MRFLTRGSLLLALLRYLRTVFRRDDPRLLPYFSSAPVRAAMKVAILILLATALIAGSAADECTFPATPAASAPTVVTNIFPSTPVFFTKVADMKTCMGKIPVDTALTTSTISALTTAANLYSFTDLAKASSGVDHVVNVRRAMRVHVLAKLRKTFFWVQVDLITQLDAIGKASYTSQVAVFYGM